MNKTGKIILWVLAIAAVVALFVINGSRASERKVMLTGVMMVVGMCWL